MEPRRPSLPSTLPALRASFHLFIYFFSTFLKANDSVNHHTNTRRGARLSISVCPPVCLHLSIRLPAYSLFTFFFSTFDKVSSGGGGVGRHTDTKSRITLTILVRRAARLCSSNCVDTPITNCQNQESKSLDRAFLLISLIKTVCVWRGGVMPGSGTEHVITGVGAPRHLQEGVPV